MAIPDYQTLMLPLLRAIADEKEHSLGEVVESVSDAFGLSPEERQQLLPSGQ
jgi:restriction system protein